MNVESVYPKVREIIADVLVVEESDIELQKRLVAELGAESIDFLDLIFQLEREFNIKIPRGQLEKKARGTLSQAEFEQSGVVTDKGIEALKKYLPEVPLEHFTPKLKVNEIPLLFTVETFCRLVLNAREQQSSAEGSGEEARI
ncbi:MAG: acyl carrier protein [Gammaproteobacteria bacterium]